MPLVLVTESDVYLCPWGTGSKLSSQQRPGVACSEIVELSTISHADDGQSTDIDPVARFDHKRRSPVATARDMASRPTSLNPRRTGQDESWVEISSQPSSSSLSSVNEDVVTTGLRIEQRPTLFSGRRRRQSRPSVPADSRSLPNTTNVEATSSQEEYEESESESDHVMTSSNEGHHPSLQQRPAISRLDEAIGYISSDGEDGNRTAINQPIFHHHHHRSNSNVDAPFTPQPNAFNRSAGDHPRNASAPGSYFPPSRPSVRPSNRQSYPSRSTHLPSNILSPSYNAALQHEEALRNSLNTLLSCAAAARGLPKAAGKGNTDTMHDPTTTSQRNNRHEPISFRLIPESALPTTTSSSPLALQETPFQPTLRRVSTSTSASSHDHKRQAALATPRSNSRERRTKKQRHSQVYDDLNTVSPTLLTWIVSAGVVVFLGALTFSAGYSLGKEAGRWEAHDLMAVTSDVDEDMLSCVREAGRSGLGLKRTLARSAVPV